MVSRSDPVTAMIRDWRLHGTAARQASLPPPLPAVHRAVLTGFLDTGGAPAAGWLEELAGRHNLAAAEAFAQLAAADLVHLDPSGAVAAAYPFSAGPTGHRVALPGRPPLWAMCAIDALGIPQMTGQDAQITSTDPYTGESIRVQAAGPACSWDPAGTVVLVGRAAPPGPSHCCTCPHINFHTDPGHARAYLAAHPDVQGRIVEQDTAVRLAGLAFGPLLTDPRSVKEH